MWFKEIKSQRNVVHALGSNFKVKTIKMRVAMKFNQMANMQVTK